MEAEKQNKRGRKAIHPQDVKNLRFQLVFSQNQINAVGGRENAYKILKEAIKC
jgi:hypothetical protein